MQRKMQRKSQSGMTLIELVIVIIVLGIIAAVAAPRFSDVSSNAAAAAYEGSRDGFKSSYVISLGAATVPGAPTVAEVMAGVDMQTCASGVCTTQDWDKDGAAKADLTVTLYQEAACTTAATAGTDTVLGYTYTKNEETIVVATHCQTD